MSQKAFETEKKCVAVFFFSFLFFIRTKQNNKENKHGDTERPLTER